jgi:hypothetical protein
MMRPLPRSFELRTAEAFSDEKANQAAYISICLKWWLGILSDKKREELIPLLETITCDLMEFFELTKSSHDNLEIEEGEDIPF